MVNQICIAGLVQALSEGLRFARAAGLDPQRVIVVSKDGPAAADGQPAQNNDSGRIQFRFCSGVGAQGSGDLR
jgi:3-hydroxyisobutyrate dehydrogenase-like beta-hydroxyacid dehydrogenase